MKQYRFSINRQNVLVTLLFIAGIVIFAVVGGILLLIVLSLAAIYLLISFMYRSLFPKKSTESSIERGTKKPSHIHSLPYSDYTIESDDNTNDQTIND